MADLIDRQIAIDAIKEIRSCIWEVDIPSPTVPEYIEHHKQMKKLMDRCDKLMINLVNSPIAQQWIPVSEGLPENEKYVLVTTVSGDVTDAKYWQKEGLWVMDLTIMSVIAWMPLPEPYKERSK